MDTAHSEASESRDAARAPGRRQTTPTEFQRVCLQRARAAADWLLRSIKACDGRGSAVYYSRWFRPWRGWMWPYPETTGYIIPTLLRYGEFADRPDCIAIAVRQADWLVSLQFADGGLPGSHVAHNRVLPPSVFNTGQMILGLVAAADHTGEHKYLNSAGRAASWLAGELDASTGTWGQHAYVKGYSPAYNTRVCWPMLEVHVRAPDDNVRAAAIRALNTIADWCQDSGAIQNWGFKPGAPAFTHTIAYTLRGFWESGRLLGKAGDRYARLAWVSAEVLRRQMELRGRLAGAYDLSLRGRYWYTCLTGNCQLALIWMKLGEQLGDARYLSAALKALQVVIDRQRIHHPDPNVRGAIPGSSPFWGRYLALRYPNWAAKFYLDALMLAHTHLQHLLESGPCVSP
jgi:hypothetical protein